MTLSRSFALLLPLGLLSISGAGNVGFPVPLLLFECSAATVAVVCDCWIALNSWTTVISG